MKKHFLSLLLCSLFCINNISQANEVLPPNPLCQTNVKNIKLVINNKLLLTQVACSEQAKQQGLMNVKLLPENNGMIFIFDRKQNLSFWMKNTLIDLSIAFIDDNWNIIDIKEMKAHDLTAVVSKKPAIFALEANSHWFSKNNIKVGDKIQMTK